MRIEAKIENVFGPSFRVGAFEFAEETFFQIVVKNNRTAVVDGDFGGLGGALERGSIADIKTVISEFVAESFGLLDAGLIERNVGLPLSDTLEVPIGLAMADEIKFHKLIIYDIIVSAWGMIRLRSNLLHHHERPRGRWFVG